MGQVSHAGLLSYLILENTSYQNQYWTSGIKIDRAKKKKKNCSSLQLCRFGQYDVQREWW